MISATRFASLCFLAIAGVLIILALQPHIAEASGQQQFTSITCTAAAPCTFTVPTYARRVTVEVWGAGGGGGGASGGVVNGVDGGNGGASAFGTGSATTTANGGSLGTKATAAAVGTGGAGGTACTPGVSCNGDVITAGTAGASGTAAANGGGDGGNPANRGGTGNTGSGVGVGGSPGGGGSGGGCAAGTGPKGGGGGGGGAYSRKTYAVGDLTPGATMYAVVGTGGTGGTSTECSAGGAGAAGEVRVTWDSVVVTSASTVTGSANVIGSISKSSGSFVIDHPLDPKNKLLFHSFVESPDVKNMYDGIATLDAHGEATIMLPDYFLALNTDFRYLASGTSEAMPDLHLVRGARREWFFGKPSFRIGGGVPHGVISWQVTGIRKDPYILANPIIPEVEKGPGQLVDKGQCIFGPLCK